MTAIFIQLTRDLYVIRLKHFLLLSYLKSMIRDNLSLPCEKRSA